MVINPTLCGETPAVFQSPLYATVAWMGSLLFIFLLHSGLDVSIASIVVGLLIFISRLFAIK